MQQPHGVPVSGSRAAVFNNGQKIKNTGKSMEDR